MRATVDNMAAPQTQSHYSSLLDIFHATKRQTFIAASGQAALDGVRQRAGPGRPVPCDIQRVACTRLRQVR